VLSVSLVLAAAGGVAVAAPSHLDRSFGGDGTILDRRLLPGILEDGTGLPGVVALADHRVVGYANRRCSLSCGPILDVARFTSSGARDVTLGPSGEGMLSLPGGEYFTGEPQRQGGIVVLPGGEMRTAYANATSATLRSIAADGASHDTTLSVRFLPDAWTPGGGTLGRTLSPGAPPEPSSYRVLVRLTAAGQLDPAFGSGGRLPVPSAIRAISAVSVGGGDAIVSGDTPRGLAVWRAPLGSGRRRGPVVAVIAGWRTALSAQATGAAVGPSGRVVVVGATTEPVPGRRDTVTTTVLSAFRPDGRVDRAFGARGSLRLGGSPSAVAVQRDGRVVVATVLRRRTTSFGGPLVVRRLRRDGRPDQSLGRVVVPLPTGFAAHEVALTIDHSGRIVVAASVFRGHVDSGLLIARLRAGS
jgi:hypothetical protein